MSMGSRPRLSELLIVAIMGLCLTGCQHVLPSDTDMPREAWRVMERIGDVRATTDNGLSSERLRPGETIDDNRQVTTSGGSLLILSRNGFQLTVGENTSFRLSAAKAPSDLFLDNGWLRIRLAMPVDREIRIKTAQFDINAAKATLTLRADPDSTILTVDAGSAVLATTDGRHRATLVAGAAATMAPSSGDDLLIRPASARGFNKVSPLPAPIQHPSNGESATPSKETRSRSATASLHGGNRAPTKASLPGNDLAILPASRPKKPASSRSEGREPITNANPLPRQAAPQSIHPLLPKGATRSSMEVNVMPSSMPEKGEGELPASQLHQQVGSPTYDPLQLQFNRLTEGLLDGL